MSPRKQKEIIFKHIELDEEIPPGTQELVEEIMAESLFRMWLKEQSSLKQSAEQKNPAQDQKTDVERSGPEMFGDNI